MMKVAHATADTLADMVDRVGQVASTIELVAEMLAANEEGRGERPALALCVRELDAIQELLKGHLLATAAAEHETEMHS